MRCKFCGNAALAIPMACAILLGFALTAGIARAADDKTYVMKIGTPTVNDTPEEFSRGFAERVEKDSGGRIKIEVYSASKLGSMPREIEGMQFGSIECTIIPPEFFVGIDERFEVLATPGLLDNLAHGQRLLAQPEVMKLMLGLGADKGLHGVGAYMALPSSLNARTPIRHLVDLKGKKIRVFASKFQTEAFERLGATPVAMSLGDVLPGVQQGTIDGAISGITVFNAMHFQDAAKYVTEINQPAIFLMVEVSKRWFDALPKDLQEIIDRDAAAESVAINPFAAGLWAKARKSWVEGGGELISLPADEQAAMMTTLAGIGDEIAKSKPQLFEAYKVVTDAAKRTRQAPNQ
ncbi:MAG TPA: TRAP transporter substrate-binding protein [Xanthobacteraceae bacterium]|nr:TRAP transporter substrate-binding protein [Xanthobacteraceae bacterium]